MILTETKWDLPSHFFSEEAGLSERTPGLHLSGILDSMDRTLYPEKYNADGSYKSDGRDFEPYRTLGFVWEHVLQDQMLTLAEQRGALIRPGEISLDGVLMNPDGYHTQDERLEEWKLTWKSARRSIEHEYWRWWCQIKSYCKALNTTKSRLRVFYVNGDYRDRRGPWPRMWEADFTQEEIDLNWAQVIAHAKSRGLLP